MGIYIIYPGKDRVWSSTVITVHTKQLWRIIPSWRRGREEEDFPDDRPSYCVEPSVDRVVQFITIARAICTKTVSILLHSLDTLLPPSSTPPTRKYTLE